MQNFINRTIEKLYTNLHKIELSVLFVVLIGIVLKYLEIEACNYVIYAGLIILAIIYFSFGFRYIDSKSKWDDFLLRVVFFSLSIFSVGTIFMLNVWSGRTIIIQAAIIGSGMALLLLVLEMSWIKKSKAIGKKELIRIAIALLISTGLSLSPLSNENHKKRYEKEYEHEYQEKLPEAEF